MLDQLWLLMGTTCHLESTSPLNLPLSVIIMYRSDSALVNIQNVSKPSSETKGTKTFGGDNALRQMINLPAVKVSLLKSLLSDTDDDDGCCSLLFPLSKKIAEVSSFPAPSSIKLGGSKCEYFESRSFVNLFGVAETPFYRFLM